ncbi:oligopeptide:H+ symporter [Phenylobacterium sp.]|uniref:peptide MFS transporter n=1 Tax=Phenylobacterium sp. TaxID=1871053 RepID=UPI0025F99B73|nr:oligopeptide:H+ symporter [Phenylobacterium sp.]
MTTPARDQPAPQRLLFGHPRALAVLAGTEFWDRISFQSMQALLTLYMVEQLLLPGHIEHVVGFAPFRAAVETVTGPLSTQALATQTFGLYLGLALFAPILGGALGDRLLGRSRSVALGALLMTAGHLCMAFDASFLLALLLLILGTGALRGNLAPQVGDLYDRDDRRRTIAFQIYGAAVNLAAFVAPVITGLLKQSYGYHVGFGFAAVGMIVGLITYLAGQRIVPETARRRTAVAHARLTGAEWRVVLLLAALVPVAASFWVAQSQIWNTYNLWVRDHLELAIGSFTVPVPWLQAVDGLAPFITLPPALWFWRWQARRGREPDEFGKMAVGCFIFAASTLWLAGGQFVTDAHGRTPLIWAVVFHLTSNLGWLFFAPTANALFSRAAPISVTATMMGLYSLSVSLGSVVSGRLGSLYERLPAAQFWALHAAVVGGGGLALLVFGATVRGRLFPRRAAVAGAAGRV